MKKRIQFEREWWSGADRRSLWRAVEERDRRADGAFVYAVRSTGIYCKPSCPARRPRLRNVRFFPSPEAAECEGFRACQRCQPSQVQPDDLKLKAVAKVCQVIDSRLAGGLGPTPENERLTLGVLGAAAGLSAPQLDRAFRKVLGITLRQYADAQRMRRLKAQLQKGDDVTKALYDAGFGSPSRLYERAPSQLGMTPAAYGRGGEGMTLQYAICDSPLGRLLVAATHRGISAVCIGESDRMLRESLRQEYPQAELLPVGGSGPSGKLDKWVRQIIEHLQGCEPHLDLPTDVRATAFERRVWKELRKIPYGATRTYKQVARSIGKPKAVRAVARACAKNPTAVVVPCHRVIRQDGDLAGYRWGIAGKKQLLEKESDTIERGRSKSRPRTTGARGNPSRTKV